MEIVQSSEATQGVPPIKIPLRYLKIESYLNFLPARHTHVQGPLERSKLEHQQMFGKPAFRTFSGHSDIWLYE